MSHNIDQEQLRKFLNFLHKQWLIDSYTHIPLQNISNATGLTNPQVLMLGNYCVSEYLIDPLYAGTALYSARINRDGISHLDIMTPSETIRKRSFSLSRKQIISIIIGVLVVIGGGSGTVYYFTVNVNPQNTGDITVTNSEHIQIVTNNGKLEVNQTPMAGNILEDGEQGNLYVDKKAGFTIQKPNVNWYFMNVADYVKKSGKGVINEYYLGGVFVGTDKPSSVMVVVQKLPISEFDLSKYIDDQINFGSKQILGQESTVVKKFVSPDGNWASFEGYVNSTAQGYGRQILHKYTDKLFLIQTTADPPETIDEETKNELKQIIESFRIII